MPGFQHPNRDNLLKLARGLYSLPEDYEGFDIAHWYRGPDGETEIGVNERDLGYPHDSLGCGCAACAVGHGPTFGIGVREDGSIAERGWFEYTDTHLIQHGTAEFGWCFESQWACNADCDFDSPIDNTARGAALRIFWLLEHGLPENWRRQMYGEAELCYTNYQPSNELLGA